MAAGAEAGAPPSRPNEGVRAWALIAQLMLALSVVASCAALLWGIATLNTLQIWSLQPGDVHEDGARSVLRTMVLLLRDRAARRSGSSAAVFVSWCGSGSRATTGT